MSIRPHLFILAAVALVAPVSLHAQHPISGTWKGDPATVKLPARPVVFAVRGGSDVCDSCAPPYRTPADRAFHKVAGRDYWDELAVDASKPDALALRFRRAGKDVGEMTAGVSADGKTLTRASSSVDNPNGVPIESTSMLTRVDATAAGAHRASGSWKPAALGPQSDAALILTYKVDGDTVRSTSPTGESYKARIGGPPVPMDGDPSGPMVQVRRPGPNRLEERYIRGGEQRSVALTTISADGRTATMRVSNRRTNTTTVYTATRQ